jgi:hypothetical protein
VRQAQEPGARITPPVREARRAAPLARWAGALAARPLGRARGPRALAALLAGLAVVLAVGIAVGLGGTGHPARTAPGAAPVPGSVTRAARWLSGPAGRLLSSVSADLGRLTVAERAANRGTVRLAGLRLSADAKAALLGPAPPRSARLYRSALTELERAGRSAATGRLRAAAASLQTGESIFTKVTAMVNAPAGAGAPGGGVQEPAGQ